MNISSYISNLLRLVGRIFIFMFTILATYKKVKSNECYHISTPITTNQQQLGWYIISPLNIHYLKIAFSSHLQIIFCVCSTCIMSNWCVWCSLLKLNISIPLFLISKYITTKMWFDKIQKIYLILKICRHLYLSHFVIGKLINDTYIMNNLMVLFKVNLKPYSYVGWAYIIHSCHVWKIQIHLPPSITPFNKSTLLLIHQKITTKND